MLVYAESFKELWKTSNSPIRRQYDPQVRHRFQYQRICQSQKVESWIQQVERVNVVSKQLTREDWPL